MSNLSAPLKFRCRYMEAALRLNAAVIDPTVTDPDVTDVRTKLEDLVKDLAEAEHEDDSSLDELRVLTESALLCAAVMSNHTGKIALPLITGKREEVVPKEFLEKFCESSERPDVTLMTPRTAYNLACALSRTTLDDKLARKGLELLLGRAFERKDVAATGRSDPFFKNIRGQVWFKELIGADPTSEIETNWLTAPYAEALKKAGVSDLAQLRKRLRTLAQRHSMSQALDNTVGVDRLAEWANLLTVHEQADVPLPWLEALDSLAIRSIGDLAKQHGALLHDALEVFSSSSGPKRIPDMASLKEVTGWVNAAKSHLPRAVL